MNATKDTIDKLIANATLATKELYFTILEDASILNYCGQAVPTLLRDVPELRMDIKFILVDLQTSMRACFATDRFYEKRYHLKNLYAGMLEGLKLLYGFGNMRKRTVWWRIGEDLQNEIVGSSTNTLFLQLKQCYDDITHALLGIESTQTDRDARNLTYHYDDDLLLVYRLTLKTNSEEEAGEKFIHYMDVLGAMLRFCNLIEDIYAANCCCLPKGEPHNDELSLLIVHKVAKVFENHPRMPEVLLTAVDKGAEQIDKYAEMKKNTVKVEEYIDKSFKNNRIDILEISIIKSLLDVQLMVSFMMADAATILRGFISAGSEVECPLTLRRLTISRVSTLNHLIGYKKDGSDSMWGRIMTIIPEGYDELKERAIQIEGRLLTMRKAGDVDRRALYVHLIDNHKYRSNIPAIVSALEDPIILMELQASQDVVKVCGDISKFMVKLMDALSTEARKARIESDRKLKKQIDGIRELTNLPNCPELLRDSMRKQLDEVERIINSFV